MMPIPESPNIGILKPVPVTTCSHTTVKGISVIFYNSSTMYKLISGLVTSVWGQESQNCILII